LRSTNSAALVLLKQARYYLDGLGATRRSLELLEPIAGASVPPEPQIEFELNLLQLRQYARLGDPTRARARLDRILTMVAERRLPHGL
jgi:hypothetical protein